MIKKSECDKHNLFCLNQLKILQILSDGKEKNPNQLCTKIGKMQIKQINPYLDSLYDYGLIVIEQLPIDNVLRYKIHIPKESMKDVKTLIKIFSKKIK